MSGGNESYEQGMAEGREDQKANILSDLVAVEQDNSSGWGGWKVDLYDIDAENPVTLCGVRDRAAAEELAETVRSNLWTWIEAARSGHLS